ncbi:MAG: Xaa-Pro aminopeptidase [Candidatus Petromonas sp.]|nr:Xaa-Pro aminopeptidase [Candidatus Petromonas sp.]
MKNNLDRFREKLIQEGLDGAVVYKPENRRYLSGFTGSSGYVVVTRDKNLFITDFRYVEQASKQCEGFEVLKHTEDRTVYDILNELNVDKLGFEEEFVTFMQYEKFNNKLQDMELVPLKGIINKLRMIKSDDEIKKIEKAANIADEAFKHILDIIKPGITEWEVSLELEGFMKKSGATGTSFESIVASGKRSSLPHGVASQKVIEKGDFVTLDFGCVYDGYCSDMTRTIVIGKASDKQKEIYEIVLEAQESALKYIKSGIKGFEADKIAREIINDEGYGEYFGHGLGHGVGLEVHEAPRLSPIGKDTLETNMVVTDEPGIYIHDFGGVRIEDLVVVTKDGCKVLSKSPKNLIEL